MKSILYTFIVNLSFIFSYMDCRGSDVIITGKVTPAVMDVYGSKEIKIRMRHSFNLADLGKFINVPLTPTGMFKTSFDITDSLEYVSFVIVDMHSQNKLVNLSRGEFQRTFDEVYLVEKGDSVHVNIGTGGSMSFSGKGSEKLNCQWQIYNIEPIPPSIKRVSSYLIGQRKMVEKLALEERTVDVSMKLRMEILEAYKENFSYSIYGMLYLDALASAEYAIVQPLHWMKFSFPDSANLEQLNNYYNSYLARKDTTQIAIKLAAKSAYYADMVFEREYNLFKLLNKDSYLEASSFKQVYELLKHKYNGEFRDRLIYICFLKLNRSFMSQQKAFIDDALGVVQDATYKNLLKDWKSKQFSAHPFELEDATGKINKLADFKGKVIVIDFWYTGCPNCITLNSAMKEIVERYKTRKDIVFLTVSIDKDKGKWIKSISSGLYTSSGTIDLYTNGLGRSHPMIQQYNITGYPRQLVIAKNGELVTSNPPRVDVGKENKQAFMTIINDQL